MVSACFASVSYSMLANLFYRQNELAQSSTLVDVTARLLDLTTYYWQVVAVDSFGTRTISVIRQFSTNNQNAAIGVIKGLVFSNATFARLAGATVTASIGGSHSSMVTEADGAYYLVTAPGTVTVSTALSGYQNKTVSSVEVPANTEEQATVSLNFALAPASNNNDLYADGLADDWESAHGLDPSDPTDALLDSDGDGLTNQQEYTAGTNPNNADTDGDGLSDRVEIEQGSNPLVNEAAVIMIILGNE